MSGEPELDGAAHEAPRRRSRPVYSTLQRLQSVSTLQPLTLSKQELAGEYAELTREALIPTAVGVMLTFIGFFVFNAIDMPPRARLPMLVADVVVMAGALWVWRLARHDDLPQILIYPLTVGLAWLIMANVLLAQVLVDTPFYTLYVDIILIAMGTLVLSTRALLVGFVGAIVPWLIITLGQTDPKMTANYAFTVVAAVTVAGITHAARRGTHAGLAALRRRDRALQASLSTAVELGEEARASLDRQVEERTAELRAAHAELEAELEARERVEHERLELRHNLQRAQRVETLGRLAGGVAHDFNNALTVISVSLQTARMLPDLSPAATELVREAERAAERAAETVRQLLAFGRKQDIKQSTLEPAGLVDDLEPVLMKIAGSRVEVTIDDASAGAAIEGDAGALEQVLLNLTLNACDAMPGGGALTVALRRTLIDAARAGAHPGARSGPHVALAVTDTGAGMPPETLARIFDPFFTTKDIGEGTGLGLSMVEGIIHQHGGFVEVASAPGEGSTFTLLLPESSTTAQVAAGRMKTPLPAPRGSEQLLLVEDDPAIRFLATTALSALGYTVESVADGGTALHHLEAAPTLPALVITDMVMPGIDGFELGRTIRERFPEMPVLFVSGYQREKLEAQGERLQTDEFLPKPYAVDELARAVRGALDGKRGSSG